MKKKLLGLAIVLSLVAALIVPMAVSAASPSGAPVVAGTDIEATGVMVAPSVTVTAPGPISFGNFVNGQNPSPSTWAWSTATWGSVTLTNGSDAAASFMVTATPDNSKGDYSAGEMYCSGIGYLSTPMVVTFGDSSNTPMGTYGALPGGASFTGTSSVSEFSLGANQTITSADAQKGAGTYIYYVQITAQCDY
jgi:hypothetical protein